MIELAIFLPLIGGLIAGIFGTRMGDRPAQLVTVIPMLVAAVISCYLLWDVGLHGNEQTIRLFTWIDSGTLELSWALRFDTLTAVMVFVVNVVSSMVHVYSIGYMSHDPVHLLHAHPCDRRQLRPDVLRLGRRGADVLPSDRFLV
jgi:NADH-quinone oxidoreductase subunit L